MRGAPPDVSPVRYKGLEIHVVPADLNGMLEAKKPGSNKVLWEQQAYNYPVDDNVEPDTQWVFIAHMFLDGDSLIIINEIGDRFKLQLDSSVVTRLPQPQWYSDISTLKESFDTKSDKDWIETTALLKKCVNNLNRSGDSSLSYNLFNDICNWKLRSQRQRTEHHRQAITDDMFSYITKSAFSFSHNNISTEVLTRIKLLQALPGVGMGLASAILTLCFPYDYAIIDYRVWKVVYGKDKRTFSENDYLRYYFDAWACARKLHWTMQEVDFFLWKQWENI